MNDVLKKLLEAGKLILPAIVPGGAAVVESAQAIAEAIAAAKDLFEPGDQSEADGTLAALQAEINAHADKTIEGLRGE